MASGIVKGLGKMKEKKVDDKSIIDKFGILKGIFL